MLTINPNSPVAEFENVAFGYDDDRRILSDISLSIPAGCFFYLTGVSGAGKTSFLSLLYLIHAPSSGQLNLFGLNTSKVRRSARADIRRHIGLIFQDFRLLDHLTTFENVALPLRIAGTDESEVQANVRALLNWVGLEGLTDRHPEILSGGQKQLVAIARAVISRPRLILADEPTGSVDDDVADRLMRLFQELHRQGTAIVVATHNETLVHRFPADRLHLDDGQLHHLAPGETLA